MTLKGSAITPGLGLVFLRSLVWSSGDWSLVVSSKIFLSWKFMYEAERRSYISRADSSTYDRVHKTPFELSYKLCIYKFP